MTKSELKQLIKEVLQEKSLTPKTTGRDMINDIVKQYVNSGNDPVTVTINRINTVEASMDFTGLRFDYTIEKSKQSMEHPFSEEVKKP